VSGASAGEKGSGGTRRGNTNGDGLCGVGSTAHGPHVHGDFVAGADGCGPERGEDEVAVCGGEVVEAALDGGADDFDVEEGGVDEGFHVLLRVSPGRMLFETGRGGAWVRTSQSLQNS